MTQTIRFVALLVSMVFLGVVALSTPLGAASTNKNITQKQPRLKSQKNREMVKKLNLTPEQKKALREIRAEHRKKMAEVDGMTRSKKVDLENEMEKPQPDQDKIKAITKELGDLQSRKLTDKVDARMKLKKLLTPEQSEQLNQIDAETGREPEPSADSKTSGSKDAENDNGN